jgi:hypothetical protein
MPHAATPGTSAMGRRRRGSLHFLSLMVLGSVWVFGPPIGLPGEPENGTPETISCPQCGAYAKRQLNGLYLCRKHHAHIFRRHTDGSYRSASDSNDGQKPDVDPGQKKDKEKRKKKRK